MSGHCTHLGKAHISYILPLENRKPCGLSELQSNCTSFVLYDRQHSGTHAVQFREQRHLSQGGYLLETLMFIVQISVGVKIAQIPVLARKGGSVCSWRPKRKWRDFSMTSSITPSCCQCCCHGDLPHLSSHPTKSDKDLEEALKFNLFPASIISALFDLPEDWVFSSSESGHNWVRKEREHSLIQFLNVKYWNLIYSNL